MARIKNPNATYFLSIFFIKIMFYSHYIELKKLMAIFRSTITTPHRTLKFLLPLEIIHLTFLKLQQVTKYIVCI